MMHSSNSSDTVASMTFAYRYSTAPMMDWTDQHWRVFARTLTRRALLYTEMVTAPALVHGNLEYLTAHDPSEYPLALQLGGSKPEELALAVKRVRDLGFCEINLNLGCPSDRVQAGAFGAALMANPDQVARCLIAMQDASGAQGPEITAKIRLGINDQNEEDSLPEFIQVLDRIGIQRIIIHARKAILGGLSTKQNREIPPLNYPLVYQIKKNFPHLTIILNGGLKSSASCLAQMNQVDGVMVGRYAYQMPSCLLEVDPLFFQSPPPHASVEDALEAYRPYVEQGLQKGLPLKHFTRHLVGLYHEVPGARLFRRVLSESAHRPGADWSVVDSALGHIRESMDYVEHSGLAS